MKKRTAAAALLLALSLTACGKKDPAPAPTQGPDTPTEPTVKTVYVHASITQEFGSTVSRTEYIFNESDRVTEVIVYTNDVETKRHSVQSDENGNFIQWTSDGSTMKYFYDDQGHSLEIAMYIDQQLVSTTAYTWEGDLRTSVTTTMAGQDMTQKVLMTYGADGQLLRQDSYSADTLVSYSIYAYDDAGQVSTMTTYNPDGSVYSIGTHTWDGNSQTIVTADRDGSVMQTAVLTYDDAKNLLTHTVYNAYGDQVSRETHTWKALEVPFDCPRASV